MSKDEHTGGVKPIILLDMDGVVADFVGAIIKSHKLDIQHDDWTDWNYHREVGLTDDEFWEPTYGSDWWFIDVEAYSWATGLFTALREIGTVVFCSTPNDAINCAADKARWLNHYLGNHQEMVFTKHKHLLAKPNVVLIDDKDSNIHDFQKAGGHGVLFPQPWNHAAWYAKEFRKDLVGNLLRMVEIVRSQRIEMAIGVLGGQRETNRFVSSLVPPLPYSVLSKEG